MEIKYILSDDMKSAELYVPVDNIIVRIWYDNKYTYNIQSSHDDIQVDIYNRDNSKVNYDPKKAFLDIYNPFTRSASTLNGIYNCQYKDFIKKSQVRKSLIDRLNGLIYFHINVIDNVKIPVDVTMLRSFITLLSYTLLVYTDALHENETLNNLVHQNIYILEYEYLYTHLMNGEHVDLTIPDMIESTIRIINSNRMGLGGYERPYNLLLPTYTKYDTLNDYIKDNKMNASERIAFIVGVLHNISKCDVNYDRQNVLYDQNNLMTIFKSPKSFDTVYIQHTANNIYNKYKHVKLR